VRLPLKSPMVAAWLFCAAFLIVAMVCVGGATRLTQSGLSITQWKPIAGVMPPGNDRAWTAEFDNYKKIPQFKQINPHMKLAQFKGIYWWEWTHRLLGRLLGLVYLAPFAIFLLMSEIPTRIIWRGGILIGLVALQGLVGWWMVASGLADRVEVAPERLMTHLGLAILLLVFTVWTAVESIEGEPRGRGAPLNWRIGTSMILVLVVLQCLLGALVAGNRAGLVFNDFPMMNGQFLPPVDWSHGVGYSFFHDQGLVQFMHRLNGYILLLYTTACAVVLSRKANDDSIKALSAFLATLIWVQAGLGVATLWSVVNMSFALLHQFTAIMLVILATVLTWKVARADRVFRSSGF